MKKTLSILFSVILLFTQVMPASAAITCEWSQGSSANDLYFCVGGFPSEAAVAEHRVEVKGQFANLNQQIGFDAATNTYYSCAEGQNILETVTNNVQQCGVNVLRTIAGCASAGIPAIILTVGTGGAGSASLVWAAGFCGSVVAGENAARAIGACNERFFGTVRNRTTGANVCQQLYTVNNVWGDEAAKDTAADYKRFVLCNQIPEQQPASRAKCEQCAAGGGIWTAIGCIESTPTSIVNQIITIGLSIAGSLALLLILAAGFMFATSSGDPKKTTEAKELLTAAIVGLLFIIFSVTILQFIGVSILRIPGLGNG